MEEESNDSIVSPENVAFTSDENHETEILIPTNRLNRSYYIREPSGSHPIAVFAFVVFPAFFGIAFYFFSRPATERMASHSSSTEAVHDLTTPTVLISIDGFRLEYFSRKENGEYLAPTLRSIAKEGVYAPDGMQPVMPSKTWPNHWTLVTGLFPESHGIVGNTMYDPKAQRWFHHDVDHPSWWKGEPIWQTLMRSAKPSSVNESVEEAQNYTTGCVFWPGSSVVKHRPNVFWKYDESVPYTRRVNRAIELLTGGASDLGRKADFVTVYFEGVDHAGHMHGPNSREVNKEIKSVDDSLKALLDKLENAGLQHNLVVVSDHGMTEVSNEKRVDLSHVIEEGAVQDILQTPMGLWLNLNVTAEQLHEQLQRFSQNNKNIQTYLKQSIPEHWHLKNNRLVTSVVTMTAIGWSAVYPHQVLVPGSENPLRMITSTRNHVAPPKVAIYGDHGYDHNENDMQAIFLAKGPAFKAGGTVKGMRSVDVYGLLCRTHSVNPAPNNGSQAILTQILA
ncbi:Bis(5'-adenosyl)-triphosphatase enpp4 [Gracilariopsis chorda]|uniref:Bis(5'-adenosyl)-triphosphatase enpp4 n=1 Tax=Gracilariopsis chorda TaxID=448386 RepID=A0A2V3J587_9FLOR|nr:Bis(5'-adenosyl)-triphosphatase enpp4 [Gracilariopsis chorda]|eukprot:PXF49534.1 Bis(5'-adenosyl)-triphosphatase enpp4 [Gracilariopsis chorda]